MGFGGASAWLFAREGANVVVTDVNDDLGQRTATQIDEETYDAIYVHLDVTREEEWTGAVQAAVSKFGRLDVLVNNAGTAVRSTVEETTMHEWQGQMDVHAKRVFLGTKHAIPEMRKAGGGSIVNVSSIYGIVGSPQSAAYHAAKGASRIFTKAVATQYANDNIRVNSVHPGYVFTPLTERVFSDPDMRDWRISKTPSGRFGKAEDIINGILYLASEESSFVTGSELIIDGGLSAQQVNQPEKP